MRSLLKEAVTEYVHFMLLWIKGHRSRKYTILFEWEERHTLSAFVFMIHTQLYLLRC